MLALSVTASQSYSSGLIYRNINASKKSIKQDEEDIASDQDVYHRGNINSGRMVVF